MKKYFIGVLILWCGISFASNSNEEQESTPFKTLRDSAFEILCNNKLLEYLSLETSNFKLVSQEWETLVRQKIGALEVSLPLTQSFERFSNLTKLRLMGDSHSPIPLMIAKFTQLRELHLKWLNKINNSTTCLTSLGCLQSLITHNCFSFHDENLRSLTTLITLKTLHLNALGKENFTDKGMEYLGYLTRLEDLHLEYLSEKITMRSFNVICTQLTSLTRLSLQWGEDNSPEINYQSLSHLTHLNRLSLSWTLNAPELHGAHFIHSLTSLQHLRICNEKIEPQHLTFLTPLNNLTSLDLRRCKALNALDSFLEIHPLPNLKIIERPLSYYYSH